MEKFDQKLGSLLSPEETAKESERAVGLHTIAIMDSGKRKIGYGDDHNDWDAHWANVHASAAYYTRLFMKLQKVLKDEEQVEEKEALRDG